MQAKFFRLSKNNLIHISWFSFPCKKVTRLIPYLEVLRIASCKARILIWFITHIILEENCACHCCCWWYQKWNPLGSETDTWAKQRQSLLNSFIRPIPVKKLDTEVCLHVEEMYKKYCHFYHLNWNKSKWNYMWCHGEDVPSRQRKVPRVDSTDARDDIKILICFKGMELVSRWAQEVNCALRRGLAVQKFAFWDEFLHLKTNGKWLEHELGRLGRLQNPAHRSQVETLPSNLAHTASDRQLNSCKQNGKGENAVQTAVWAAKQKKSQRGLPGRLLDQDPAFQNCAYPNKKYYSRK